MAPFAKQVIVEAKIRSNPEAKATAICNYRQKFEGVTITKGDELNITNTAQTATWVWQPLKDYKTDLNNGSWNTGYATISPRLSVGTITEEIEMTYFSISMSDELKAQVRQKFSLSETAINRGNMLNSTSSTVSLTQEFLFWGDGHVSDSNVSRLFSFCSEGQDQNVDYILTAQYSKLIECLKACSVDLKLNVRVQTKSDYIEQDYFINVADDSLKIVASDVTMDNPNLEY